MPRSRRLHDRELLDALEALEPEPFTGIARRTTWGARDPLIGNAAGGRWHLQDSFEALDTSLEANGSLAEVYFHLSRAPIFSSAHVRLWRLRVQTRRTLRLADMEALRRLRIAGAKYAATDHARTREIGAAAYFLEFDGRLVPSARWPCLNRVLFLDRLDPDALVVADAADVNWPAWTEARKWS